MDKVVAYTNLISCQPCKLLHPILEELESEGLSIDYKHLESDLSDFQAAGVRSTPTLILINSEGEQARLTGFKTKQQIEDWIAESK